MANFFEQFVEDDEQQPAQTAPPTPPKPQPAPTAADAAQPNFFEQFVDEPTEPQAPVAGVSAESRPADPPEPDQEIRPPELGSAGQALDPTITEQVKDFGTGVKRGAVNLTGTIAKGHAGIGLSDPADVMPVFAELQNAKNWDDKAQADFLQGMSTKLVRSPELVKRLIGTAADLRHGRIKSIEEDPELVKLFSESMMDPRQTEMYKLGQSIQDYAEKTYKGDPRLAGTLQDEVAQGFGSLGPFVALALVPFAGPALSTSAGIAVGQGEALERAVGALEKGEDVSRGQLLDAMGLGAIPGATEALPVETLLDRIPKPKWAEAMGTIGRILGQAAIEGGQEMVQQMGQNIIENYVYDPDQDISEGVLHAGGIGAIVGGGAQTAMEGGRKITDTILPVNREAKQDKEELRPTPEQIEQTVSVDAKGDQQPVERVVPDARPEGVIEVDRRDPQLKDLQAQAILGEAGYTTEQIRDMNPEEFTENMREAQEVGVSVPDDAGTKKAPVDLDQGGSIEQVREKVEPEPSEAQKEAGNYKKGHIKLHGLDITIENAKGSERRGKDAGGVEWAVTMPADYGYIKRTTGADNDQVDVYIGDKHESQKAFIVDQLDPETGKFDEHKVILGAENIPEAINLYDEGFSDGRGMDRIGGIKPVSIDGFKEWLKGDTKTEAVKGQEDATGALQDAAVSTQAPQDGAVELDQQPVPPNKIGVEAGPAVSDSDGVRDVERRTGAEGATEPASAPDAVRQDEGVADDTGRDAEPVTLPEGEPSTAPSADPSGPRVMVNEVGRDGKTDAERGGPLDATDRKSGNITEQFIAANHLKKPQRDQLMKLRDQDGGSDATDAIGEINAELKNLVAKMGREGKSIDEALNTEQPGQDELSLQGGIGWVEQILDAVKEAGTGAAIGPGDGVIGDASPWAFDDVPQGGNAVFNAIWNARSYLAELAESGAPVTTWEAPETPSPNANTDRKPKAEVFPKPEETVNADKQAALAGTIEQTEADKIVQSWKDTAKKIGKDHDNSNKMVVSLYDYTGAWSQPWRDAGYQVLQYDIKTGEDVLIDDWLWTNIEEARAAGIEVVGVMSACPCTTFTVSGSRWWKPRHDVESKEMLSKTFGENAVLSGAKSALEYNKMLLEASYDAVEAANPTGWHVLENPMGRIEKVTDLPPPSMRFHPNNYGNPYTKRTALFGDFNTDLPTANVNPVEGSKVQSKLRGDSAEGKEQRSTTPEGFSYAFFMANDPVARHLDLNYETLVDDGFVSRGDFGNNIRGTSDSQSRAKQFPANYQDGEIWLSHPNAAELPEVKAAEKRIGVKAKFDDEHPGRKGMGAFWHGMDLSTNKNMAELLESKDWTTPNMVANGVALRLTTKGELSTKNARKILEAFDVKHPPKKTLKDFLSRTNLAKLEKSYGINYDFNASNATRAWGIIYALDEGYLEFKRGRFAQPTEKFHELVKKPVAEGVEPEGQTGTNASPDVPPASTNKRIDKIRAMLGGAVSRAELFDTLGETLNISVLRDLRQLAKEEQSYDRLRALRSVMKFAEEKTVGRRPDQSRFKGRGKTAKLEKAVKDWQRRTDRFKPVYNNIDDKLTGLMDAAEIEADISAGDNVTLDAKEMELFDGRSGKSVSGTIEGTYHRSDGDIAGSIVPRAGGPGAGGILFVNPTELTSGMVKKLDPGKDEKGEPAPLSAMGGKIFITPEGELSSDVKQVIVESGVPNNPKATAAERKRVVIDGIYKTPREAGFDGPGENSGPIVKFTDYDGQSSFTNFSNLKQNMVTIREDKAPPPLPGGLIEVGSPPAPSDQRPGEMPKPHDLNLLVGKSGPQAFDSFKEISETYRRTIDELNVGGSETPEAILVDMEGNEYGWISYNGRVWLRAWGDEPGSEKIVYSPGSKDFEGLTAKEADDLLQSDPDKYTAQPPSLPAPNEGEVDASLAKIAKDDAADPLVDALRQRFMQDDGGFSTIAEARKFAKDQGFEAKAGTAFAKELEEKIELALVQAAREIIAQGRSAEATYDSLVDLYARQPKLGVRTSKSMADQAYSTPVPLAFLAQHLAGIGPDTKVFEPTAGNGALVTAASPGNVIANEISDVRAEQLRQQGFKVTQNTLPGDQPNAVRQAGEADVVIMNPPFGAVKQEDGASQVFTAGDLKTTAIDHAIALNALEAMPDAGRAVLIVGGINNKIIDPKERGKAYNQKQKREFYRRLHSRYNVVDHFTVDGSLYERQGAGWPVDVIVIDGRGKSDMRLPAVNVPQQYFNWQDLKEKLDGQTAVSGIADKRTGEVAESQPGLESGGKPVIETDGGGRDTVEQSTVRQPGKLRRDPSGPKPAGVRGLKSGPTLRDKLATEQRDKRDGAGEPSVDSRTDLEEPQAQQNYTAASNQRSLETLIPSNMRSAAANALVGVESMHGSVDAFVAEQLQYDADSLARAFGAEQIDAIALAITNAEKGKAFIIGDQTGIGKGRVVAGLLRWARLQGMAPVFVTEKPNLYGDMIRDLNDIGMPDLLGREVNAVMTNPSTRVPLDDAALDWFNEAEDIKEANADRPPEKRQKTPPKRGKFLTSGSPATVDKQLDKIRNEGLGDVDIIFTTYDQMNTVRGNETKRRNFISAMAPESFIVLDESHNAFGTAAGSWGPGNNEDGSPKAPDRATFVRQIVENSKGTMFSSATYAKRPDGMDLYARTDLGDAVDDIKNLGDTISRGGVPMQQIVASMLADAGQYVRRERSYKGINYDMETAPVDDDAYAGFVSSLQNIVDAEELLKASPQYEEWVEMNTAEVGGGMARDTAVGNVGVTSTNFTSLMHNIVSQMLLSLKADVAADRAIASLKAGEKPVLTVANTMGAFIDTYARENVLAPGDLLDLRFSDVVENYLERTRRITVTIDDQKFHQTMPYNRMPAYVKEMYNDARAAIAKIPDVPISPIDHIKHRLREAGYRVGEITGRTSMVDYSGGTATYEMRPTREIKPAGRRSTVNQFNNGQVDVMILNRAGSTGLSLHTSSQFKDQTPRRMIIVQAEGNIDTHVQMLGRINRTGQVNLPAYSQLVADIPAEARPAAVLAKKMASLSANTTASRKSALSSDAVDFMNKYGDAVVASVLQDNPEWIFKMRLPEDNNEDIARRATGKLVMLDPKDQQQFLDTVQETYTELIDQLDKTGQNDLEAKFVDLKAETINTAEMRKPQGTSPFTQAVNLERVEIDAPGLAFKPQELAGVISENIPDVEGETPVAILESADRTSYDRYSRLRQEWQPKHDKWLNDAIAAKKTDDAKNTLRAEGNTLAQVWNGIMGTGKPGAIIQVTLKDGTQVPGVVVDVFRKGNAKSPMALSGWRLKVAVPHNARDMTIPFSAISTLNHTAGTDNAVLIQPKDHFDSAAIVMEAFDKAATTGRQERYMMTGNIVAGFEMAPGQIMNFSDNKGNVRQGILMPQTFDEGKFMADRPVRFKTAAQVTEFMGQTDQVEVTSTDKLITLSRFGNQYELELPRGRATGGQYFLQQSVRQAANDAFTSVGNRMRWQGERKQAQAVLDAMIKHGAVFETRTDQEKAQAIVDGKKPVQPAIAPPPEMLLGPPKNRNFNLLLSGNEYNRVKGAIDEIAQRVLGRSLRLVELKHSLKDGMAAGLHDPYTGIISIASGSPVDPEWTIRHESIHALRRAGVLTKSEWAVLERQAKKWRNWYEVDERYGDYYAAWGAEFEEMALNEEGVADAFADYYKYREYDDPVIQKIFSRLARFIEQVSNWLQGNGYTSAQQIFENIETGRVGERVPAIPTTQPPSPEPVFAQRPALLPRNVTHLPSNLQRMLASVSSRASELALFARRKMQDRFIDVKRLQEYLAEKSGQAITLFQDVYLAESLYYGKTGKRMDDLRNDVFEPLMAKMNKLGISVEQLDEYLYARHAQERNERIAQINPKLPDAGSGMSTAEADQILDDFKNQGLTGDLDILARDVDDLLAKTRRDMLRDGLISQDTHNQWHSQYRHYVPLRGWEANPDQDGDADRPNIGRRFDVRGKEARAALGRRSRADSPLAYIMLQAQQGIIRGEKNRVSKAFLRLAQANPDKSMWEIHPRKPQRYLNKTTGLVQERMVADDYAPNVLSVKIGGKPTYIKMKDPEIAKAMKGLGSDNLGAFGMALHKVNRFLSAMSTQYNPEFIMTNLTRDLSTSLINLSEVESKGLRTKVVKDIPKAMKGVYGGLKGKRNTDWERYYHEFADQGGKIGFFGLDTIEDQKKNMEKELAKLQPGMSQKAWNKVVDGMDLVGNLNMAVENALRLSTYVNARRAGIKKPEAASLARELTVNFNRRGEWGTAMNAMYLFYNAGIQGTVRMLQALHHPKVRKLVYGIMASSFIIDLLNRWVSEDDDDGENFYDKIPFWEKERNLILMWPGGGGRYTKIPLPWGYNVFHVMGQQTGAVAFGKPTIGQGAFNIGKSALNAFNPIGGSDRIARMLSPTILDPFFDLGANKDYLDRKIKPDDFPGSVPRPESQKYWNTVNPVFRDVAEWLNSISGGNEVRPGAIDVSPEVMEYWSDFVAGGFGAFVSRSFNFGVKVGTKEDIEAYQVPFTRRFYGSPTEYGEKQGYYDMRDEVRLTAKEFELFKEKRNRQKMDEIRSRPEFRMINTIKATDKTLRQLRKNVRILRKKEGLSDDQRRTRIQRLERRMLKVMEQARSRMNRLREIE